MNDFRQCCVVEQHVGLEASAVKDVPAQASEGAPRIKQSDRTFL
jgi:hypothetical protein